MRDGERALAALGLVYQPGSRVSPPGIVKITQAAGILRSFTDREREFLVGMVEPRALVSGLTSEFLERVKRAAARRSFLMPGPIYRDHRADLRRYIEVNDLKVEYQSPMAYAFFDNGHQTMYRTAPSNITMTAEVENIGADALFDYYDMNKRMAFMVQCGGRVYEFRGRAEFTVKQEEWLYDRAGRTVVNATFYPDGPVMTRVSIAPVRQTLNQKEEAIVAARLIDREIALHLRKAMEDMLRYRSDAPATDISLLTYKGKPLM